jgi:hypothetical protein
VWQLQKSSLKERKNINNIKLYFFLLQRGFKWLKCSTRNGWNTYKDNKKLVQLVKGTKRAKKTVPLFCWITGKKKWL